VHNLATESEFRNGLTDAPTRDGLLTATTMAGYEGAIAFGHDGSASSYAYKTVATTAGPAAMSVFVQMDDGAAPTLSAVAPTSSDGSFALVVGGSPVAPGTYTIENVGAGVYKVSGNLTIAGGSANYGVVKYSSNNSRTFKVTGYQINAGALTSYVPTTTAPVYLMRTPDYTYGVPGLLLEGARTNLASTAFTNWTTFRSAAPTEGGDGFWSFVATGTAPDFGAFRQNAPTWFSNTGYCYSVEIIPVAGRTYAIEFVDTASGFLGGASTFAFSTPSSAPTIVNSGRATGQAVLTQRGSWLVWITFTTQAAPNYNYYAARCASHFGSGELLKMTLPQLEIGSYPTSRIPNATIGTLLRVADPAPMTGALFTEYFGSPATGAVLVEFSFPRVVGGGTVFPTVWEIALIGGELLRLWTNHLGQVVMGGYGGVAPNGEVPILTGLLNGQTVKTLVWWTASEIKACANGGAVVTLGTYRNISAANRFNLGSTQSTAVHLDSVIHKLRTSVTLPAADLITNAQAQALTV
jgi:hypothetical protein